MPAATASLRSGTACCQFAACVTPRIQSSRFWHSLQNPMNMGALQCSGMLGSCLPPSLPLPGGEALRRPRPSAAFLPLGCLLSSLALPLLLPGRSSAALSASRSDAASASAAASARLLFKCRLLSRPPGCCGAAEGSQSSNSSSSPSFRMSNSVAPSPQEALAEAPPPDARWKPDTRRRLCGVAACARIQ